MSDGIVVRKCAGMDDFARCVDLQREIWGEEDLEVEPATLFVVASETGGQVLGAFDGSRMVGFTLAIVGFRNEQVFLHSHMTGVLADYRDRGVGRALKLFQREDALGRGISMIGWTFDPLEARNAHFNLNRLGAISRRYLPNLYGVTTSPLHWGLPTDRLWVEWHLDSKRVAKAAASSDDSVLAPQKSESAVSVVIPSGMEGWKKADGVRAVREQKKIRDEFLSWFARGYAAVGAQATDKGVEYLLAPWSEL
jgi:predicted GNAT superfamily acetyltransferase